jgi:hypothetical protein
MADAAILIGWNEPKNGREMQAASLFGESIDYYSRLMKDGTIESFEPVVLHRHGGDFNGFILLRGDGSKLDTLQRSDTFVEFTIRATHCLSGFGVIRGWVGEGLQRIMAQWMAAIPK